jgi:hypothetical protein
LFLAVVEQSSPGTHRSLQVEASFPVVVELKVENLPLPGADFGVTNFSQIQPNIFFS